MVAIASSMPKLPWLVSEMLSAIRPDWRFRFGTQLICRKANGQTSITVTD